MCKWWMCFCDNSISYLCSKTCDVFLILFTYTYWNFLSIFGKYYPVHGIWPSLKLVQACKTIKNWFFSKKDVFLFIHLFIFLRKPSFNTFGASRRQFVHKITYFHKNSDSQSFDWSFLIINLMFLRKFYHSRMKYTILMIGPSF